MANEFTRHQFANLVGGHLYETAGGKRVRTTIPHPVWGGVILGEFIDDKEVNKTQYAWMLHSGKYLHSGGRLHGWNLATLLMPS